jgi:hypothetical protein
MFLPRSSQEKSLLLARLLGWQCVYAADGVCAVIRGREFVGTSTAFWYTESGPHVDFYEAENMALAWKIMTRVVELDSHLEADFKMWWHGQALYQIKSPKIAQQLWLDKILELAIQAELLAA